MKPARSPGAQGSSGGLRIAVTLGDPRGIGPEVMSAAALALLEESRDLQVTLLGGAKSWTGDFEGLRHIATGSFDGSLASAGDMSLRALRMGVELALSDEIDGLVTGPVHKPALRAAGASAPGQTELLQELTGAKTVGMLMCAETTRVGGPLRVLLATTHMPLREVAGHLSVQLIEDQALLLRDELVRGWGIPRPRIAICALNPHASDAGLFGNEEALIFEPAVSALREKGVEVAGPLPADTAFLEMVEERADAVVAPYHDVGMAVFKTLAFGGGVNVTLGLPFPRTSPDHGTAFDLVGTGRADSGSALEALRLAARLCVSGDEPPL